MVCHNFCFCFLNSVCKHLSDHLRNLVLIFFYMIRLCLKADNKVMSFLDDGVMDNTTFFFNPFLSPYVLLPGAGQREML